MVTIVYLMNLRGYWYVKCSCLHLKCCPLVVHVLTLHWTARDTKQSSREFIVYSVMATVTRALKLSEVLSKICFIITQTLKVNTFIQAWVTCWLYITHSQVTYWFVSLRQTFSISYVLPSLKLTMRIHLSHLVLDYLSEEILLCSVSIDYYLPLLCYQCPWCSRWDI